MPPSQEERESTLELLNDEFNRLIGHQLDSGNAVDTKATFFMGAAAVVAQILVANDHSEVLGGLAIALLVVAFGAGAWCIWIRAWNTPPDAKTATTYYLNNALQGPEHLRQAVLQEMVLMKRDAVVENRQHGKRKAVAWWVMLVALGLGVSLSLLSILEAPSGTRARQHWRHCEHSCGGPRWRGPAEN